MAQYIKILKIEILKGKEEKKKKHHLVETIRSP